MSRKGKDRFYVTVPRDYDDVCRRLSDAKVKVNVTVVVESDGKTIPVPIGARRVTYDKGCKMFIIYLPRGLNDQVWSKITGKKWI